MKYLLKNKRKIAVFIVISVITSIYMIMFLPDIFRYITGQEEKSIIFIIATITGIILIFASLAVLFTKNEEINFRGIVTAILRLIYTLFFMFVIGIMAGLLSGISAVIINNIFKSMLYFDQIKGLINGTSAVLTLLLMPFTISAFWVGVNSSENILKDLMTCTFRIGKTYFYLMALMVLSFAAGMLITIIFGYFTDNTVALIIKIVLLSLIGFAGMLISENICS